tara:strand:+ start:368 stop:538 length:171 start_codon:yes stop_codon:yes gene_type:complete
MKIIETQYGLFIKRYGKIFEYVGTAWLEVPIITAKKSVKLQNKINKVEEQINETQQ